MFEYGFNDNLIQHHLTQKGIPLVPNRLIPVIPSIKAYDEKAASFRGKAHIGTLFPTLCILIKPADAPQSDQPSVVRRQLPVMFTHHGLPSHDLS